MSYNKELETNKQAKQAYNQRLKEEAAKRLKANAAYKKEQKSK